MRKPIPTAVIPKCDAGIKVKRCWRSNRYPSFRFAGLRNGVGYRVGWRCTLVKDGASWLPVTFSREDAPAGRAKESPSSHVMADIASS